MAVKVVTRHNASHAMMPIFSTHQNVSVVSQHTEKVVIAVTKRDASHAMMPIFSTH